MSEDTFSRWLSGLDFEYWSTGQHKVEPAVFFEKWAQGEAVLLDVRTLEESGDALGQYFENVIRPSWRPVQAVRGEGRDG